jgi:integrase
MERVRDRACRFGGGEDVAACVRRPSVVDAVAGARQAMTSACRLAGVPSFSPHDLRHRRLTIWHHDGVPAKVLADRAGHAKASMSLDTYRHVLDPGEVADGELERLLMGS